MSVEPKRKCGWRAVNGLYLVAEGFWGGCDRLPVPLTACLACGEGVHFPRSPREVNPLKLFGRHDDTGECEDALCHICQPDDGAAYLLGVGEQFYKTPQDFCEEARRQGISKRIAAVPKHLKLGKTWIYLVHKKAIKLPNDEAGNEQWGMGIFAAFVPARLEMPIWESSATPEYLAELEKRKISAVKIPDGDKDHAPREKRTKVRGQVIPQEAMSSFPPGAQPLLPLEDEVAQEGGSDEDTGGDE